MKIISNSKNQEIIIAFHEKLNNMEGERAKSDLKKLASHSIKAPAKRILAVDDSITMLYSYQIMASNLNVDIITAINGKEALECLEQEKKIDLIITDMNMPVMDGIDFIRKVRAKPSLKNIPIIMATTESQKSQEQIAMNAGVNSFVRKPFTVRFIEDKVKNFIF